MTMLVYAEVLRFVYAFSMRWPGLLTRVGLLALVGAVVLAAWQLRNPARKSLTGRADIAVRITGVGADGGFEVKVQGDGFMIPFRSARKAVRCAVAIQRAMSAYGVHSVAPIALRIGLHTGEATRKDTTCSGAA
jgi:class 3 adenylate cyclase